MNIAVIVDIDSDREGGQVIVQQVDRTSKGKLTPTSTAGTIEQMAALCEGICTLIHCADQADEKSSAESLRSCIKHITEGFADASYKGIIEKQGD